MIKFIEDKELCIKLKEKGFDEGCILQFRGEDTQPICQMGYELNYEKNSDYNNEDNYWLACPTYCQVSDWFRDKHDLIITVESTFAPKYNTKYSFRITGANSRSSSASERFVDVTSANHTFTRASSNHPKYKTIPTLMAEYYDAFKIAIEEGLKLI